MSEQRDLETGECYGYNVCKECRDDLYKAVDRQGAAALCRQCPAGNKVAYTRHCELYRGKPKRFYLCVECLIRAKKVNADAAPKFRAIAVEPNMVALANAREKKEAEKVEAAQ